MRIIGVILGIIFVAALAVMLWQAIFPMEKLLAAEEKESGVVYLRVETQLYGGNDLWGPFEGVGIYLAPYSGPEVAVDPSLPGTQRQETALVESVDGINVAVTTFELSPGLGYWVWVDQATLPQNCAVWLPIIDTDGVDEIYPRVEKAVVLAPDYEGNTFVVKFQIVCGDEFIPAAPLEPTNPPGPTSTPPVNTPVPPTRTPPPEPTDTPPPPPTPKPTTVGCNCPTPVEPLPTLPPPTEWEPTPTATPIH